MNGAHNIKNFWPRPWGPRKGSKGQTLSVFSQMKDTKHIRQVFYSVAWVMPYGVGLGGT